MVSFGESHVTIDTSNEKVIVFNVSLIMRWYRKDFYKSSIGLVGIIFVSLRKGDEPENADVFLKYFDQKTNIPEQLPLNKEELMIWDKKFFENLLTLKKGKKFKIKWDKYDWGTNKK
jgi:hypothetical protein